MDESEDAEIIRGEGGATNRDDSPITVSDESSFNSITPLQKKREVKLDQNNEERKLKSAIRTRSQVSEVDRLYFESYSQSLIHREMLADTVRMKAYEEAINELAAEKYVIDVGAGTGVLSIIAARAGAKKVVAIEASGISSAASENFISNRL